jgi:superfamily II DNA helicase RecQ
MASKYFHHIGEWQVVICKTCQYAVWPTQIEGHLKNRQHRVSRKQAITISEEVQQWPGVVRFPSEFEVPAFVEVPVDGVTVWSDGSKCELDDGECTYVCRRIDSMKHHWRKAHGFSAGQTRGGSGMLRKEDIERQVSQHCRRVQCQRFFVQKEHSQFFEVRTQHDSGGTNTAADPNDGQVWSRAWERASQHYETIRADNTIRAGAVDEVNPWLRRTGWVPFLEGCNGREILQSIREPVVDDARGEVEEEGLCNEKVAAMIWQAMGDVASISQTTVSRSGVMLRFEAIRTESNKISYHPLEPYQDRTQIGRQGRAWQQIMMFFVRTQYPHQWKSPSYRFTQRQRRAFERLTTLAQQAVENHVDEDGSSESSTFGGAEDEEKEGDGEIAKPYDQPGSPTMQPMSELQRACLSFGIELLNQTIHNREYDMALVCALAALGVSPSGRGFRSADTYPSITSAIIKVAHFMVVQYAEQLAQPTTSEQYGACSSPCEFDDSGYESEETTAQDRRRGRSSFEWVRKMMDGFMVRGCGSPMQWMLDLRSYGMKIAFNTTSAGHVNWRDGDTLEYKATKFNMAEFRGMVGKLCQDTRRALFDDLMFAPNAKDVPAVPWTQLYDDPSNDDIGWSFIRDQRSQLPVEGTDWLFERIGSRSDLRRRFVRPGSTSGIDRARVGDWMRQVAAFRGKLLVLMHMTGGQPARGPEILSVRHRNTAQGGHRNLFIEDGMVVFVTRYHKGFEVKGDVKIIHRYLPREVGELVVWYLWLVLPFVQRMQAMLWEQGTVSDHLWSADADGRKWTTERMKHELQRVSEAGLGQSINIAAYRQIAIAISRRWIRRGISEATDEQGDDGEWLQEDPSGDIADEQATHSPHVAGAVYARETQELAGATASRRQQFRAISIDWHRFLGFPSTESVFQVGVKRKRCPFENDAEESRTERQVRLRQMDAQAELQRMMRKETSFRSVQGEAMQAIQEGRSPIVVVMPTGAGKSVLFMLPAFVQIGGVTIVVVPLKALRTDMMVRCGALSIRCAVWEQDRTVDGASIVLVTPEKAVSPEFGTFVSRIRQTQRLDRIVIDECHVILNDRWDFRQHLQQLGKLAFAETQMVLLTATLPPSDEDELFRRMYWRREEVTLIRASTVRPNIEYSVVDGPTEQAKRIEQVSDLVGEVLMDQSRPEAKAVVMCESKPEIQAIVESGLFPCEPFHADMAEDRKEEVLDDFRSGRVRAIVASGAFGMGIDIADIRLIVHMDEPRNMRDYGQASGRAGRDGLHSRAIIIRGGLRFHDHRVQEFVDRRRTQCRRIGVDAYLDGDGTRKRCSTAEVQCNQCQRHSHEQHMREEVVMQKRERSVPQFRRKQQVQDRALWQERLERRLEEWKSVCVMCHARGRDSMHSISRCGHEESGIAEEERRKVQKTIRYPSNVVCYKCGVPRVVCRRWSADGRVVVDGQQDCQFYGILIGVVYGIKYGYVQVWDKWKERAWKRGLTVSTDREVVATLASKVSGEYGGSEMLDAFMWLTDRIQGQ